MDFPLDLDRCEDSLCCAWEGYEERIPLGVDFLPIVFLKAGADYPSLLFQQSCVAIIQHFHELGRTFDVGEEEGDRAFGENCLLFVHRAIRDLTTDP
jgi:hypothetical protein